MVLPLYINASHFDRAQGALYEALQVLAPATGNQARDAGPTPERWLEVRCCPCDCVVFVRA